MNPAFIEYRFVQLGKIMLFLPSRFHRAKLLVKKITALLAEKVVWKTMKNGASLLQTPTWIVKCDTKVKLGMSF